MLTRCRWAEHDEMRAYHDEEWGVPIHDDTGLFELLSLEGAQAGLSWLTVLRRRPAYRTAFCGFDPAEVAGLTPEEIERLVADPGLIRHRGKIESVVSNAALVLEIQQQGGSLDALLWSFAAGHPRVPEGPAERGPPSSTPASTAMSKELKARGFRFVGPTTCYALMQAAGLVNDHEPTCFRREAMVD